MKSPFKIEDYNPLTPKEKRQRLPPGQYLAKRWPVLSAEKTPKFDGKNWDVKIDGLIEKPLTWTWEEFKKLPKVDQVSDLHCVTTWSLFDQKFSGVSFKTIVDLVKPLQKARYVTFEAQSGYTSALPLKEGYLLENDVMLAYEHDGKSLEPDHGGPLRSLVPQLYLWKSVKWLTKMTFTGEWISGFWESRGYSMTGDPHNETRYSSQEKPIRRNHKIR
ncbi:MAG: molybdopterin-dependent oxidoreductase [Candidatus Kariarchaeaceae archaeon]|jgi:DMSO/TMAO reductase YedYZ molybdopterin-dependent catalytic subunit